LFDPRILLQGDSNTITFEHDPSIRNQVFELFSTNQGPEGQATKLSELLCLSAESSSASGPGYRDVFRGVDRAVHGTH